ncbi:LysM peptidoglycan-binding domain-containing protein [Neisseria sp. DTU_2021_1001991_1_SI_NGA_ILE_055]|uniref:LysM peptidoglycan-binding domain-containing protein n=1 Tax=Neisseria sp. DTU_2021_1001991_1_SI_NGA_ILE_055 TaxID=3077590 RepID=UPI0028EC52AE|nr:LysM peptidoglycan-binding domain-containing protein [Neisseria sp. DTU_2021_1001991_1_SI_NGA_ILE_055]WNS83862.1 LysM peptidoglycan-binding domain-containing protein [Neisseria sp. DTU_2021_1001991_1_SI_NGA_ILE_055]
MAKLKTIALTVSSLSAVSATAYAQNATPNQVGMAMMRLNSALLDQAKAQTFGSGSLWASLRKDFRINEVNTELVRRHENKFAANSAYFDRTISRSKPYMYHIANEVKKRNMPAEIALLPFIESAFVTKAKSHVGASGLWQFMPATGRHFGLEKTPLYDGRHDIYAATDAALNYLQYLHGMFGDWSLALAAYNWGEGNVGRAVNRARAQGLEPTYENLRMPNETRNYVPKLLAVRNIVANPQTFGMNISEISNQPYFKSISIDKPIDNSTIARFANISESELLALNPGFNAPVFIPKNNRRLLLPVAAVSTFEKNYRNANPDTLMSWDIYTSLGNKKLNAIANDTGMSVAELKRLNGLSGNAVSKGRSILVAKNSASQSQDIINFIDKDNTPDTYQSNMPAMSPIIASNTVEPVKVAQNTVTNIVAPVVPQSSKPVDFIARSKAENVTSVVVTETKAQPQVANAEVSAPVVAMTHATTETVAKNVAEAPKSAIPADLTAPTVASSNNVALTAEAETVAAAPAQEEHDDLMALVQSRPEEEPAATVAEAIPENKQVQTVVTAESARTARIAANMAKQQHRINARLARIGGQQNTQTVALEAGTHRVEDGDTLFNISKRYNLSVADLIIANNIKGNNIKKGQILRVTAAPAKVRSNPVQNVSYTVRKGDTLNTIASRFNVDVNDIRRWNRNTRTVTPGQRLKLIGS